MQGEIIKFYSRKTQVSYQGVKGNQGYAVCPSFGGYFNGYGAFNTFPEYELNVVWLTPKGKYEHQNIRNYVKSITNNRRITAQYLQRLTERNKGKKVNLIWSQERNRRIIDNLDVLDFDVNDVN